MNIPANLKYTKDHEWALIEGKTVTVGITDHAQSSLGDIVFVELPKTGRTLKKGETFGVVESIKAVSDLYAPISGKVLEANTHLPDDPAAINKAPYKNWLVKLDLVDTAEVGQLLSPGDYEKFVASLA